MIVCPESIVPRFDSSIIKWWILAGGVKCIPIWQNHPCLSGWPTRHRCRNACPENSPALQCWEPCRKNGQSPGGTEEPLPSAAARASGQSACFTVGSGGFATGCSDHSGASSAQAALTIATATAKWQRRPGGRDIIVGNDWICRPSLKDSFGNSQRQRRWKSSLVTSDSMSEAMR